MNLILAIREWLYTSGPTSFILCIFGLPILFSFRWFVEKIKERQPNNIATGSLMPRWEQQRRVDTQFWRLARTLVYCLIGTIAFMLIGEAVFDNQYEKVPAYTIVANGSDHIGRVFRHNEYVLKSEMDSLRKQGYPVLVSYAPKVSTVTLSVSPITENPKVMRILYSLEIETTPDIVGFTKVWRENGMTKSEKFVGMLLYDFQFDLSKKLAKFNNPLRLQQQDEFRDLVMEFLRPKIENTGIRIRSVSFQVL